jgi:hypothetical protein
MGFNERFIYCSKCHFLIVSLNYVQLYHNIEEPTINRLPFRLRFLNSSDLCGFQDECSLNFDPYKKDKMVHLKTALKDFAVIVYIKKFINDK